MSDADIVERLTEVRGIGSWTVEMLLIFRLGRPDVLPVTDYGVRKGYRAHLSARAQIAPARSRRSAQARCGVPARPALGALPLRGKLVPVARLRSGQKRRTCRALRAIDVRSPSRKIALSGAMQQSCSRTASGSSCLLASASSAFTATFISRRARIPGWRRWRRRTRAAPYHDWNERICAECYAPNGAARIVNIKNQIMRIVNNYARISFNFGPTLLSWLKENAPRTYRMILDGESRSRKRYRGHSSAMAQVYNHMIMPLASTRDRVTQIRWGIADYKSSFGVAARGHVAA